MESEKKADLEKASSADLTQASQTSTVSSLGYLADVESGGSFSSSTSTQLILSQDRSFLPSSSSSLSFDSDSIGILEDSKESSEKGSVSQRQDEQSGGGEEAIRGSVKVKSFDDLLEFSDSESQSIPSQSQGKKMGDPELLIFFGSETGNESSEKSSEKSSSLGILEDFA